MTTAAREQAASAPGGTFVTGSTDPTTIYTPEQLSDEHRAIRDAVTGSVTA